jgi:hypothetical protein
MAVTGVVKNEKLRHTPLPAVAERGGARPFNVIADLSATNESFFRQ